MLGLLRARFAQTPIYYQNGFRVTSTVGYVGAFFYGMDTSYRRDFIGELSYGVACGVFYGTLVGLPMAVIWPVSVPVLATARVLGNR